MNQLSFLETRARTTDPETSHNAAKAAAGEKAAGERIAIRLALGFAPLTAREVAQRTGIDYITVQRRISEVAGIAKTDESRNGCRIWRAIP